MPDTNKIYPKSRSAVTKLGWKRAVQRDKLLKESEIKLKKFKWSEPNSRSELQGWGFYGSLSGAEVDRSRFSSEWKFPLLLLAFNRKKNAHIYIYFCCVFLFPRLCKLVLCGISFLTTIYP